jgi:NMD protein affecting ribosome stability and mRNA decay
MPKTATITYESELVVETCCNCGVPFAIHRPQYDQLQESGKTFYCPAGHPQHYTRNQRLADELEKLKRELEVAQEDVEYWNNQAEAQALAAREARRAAGTAKASLTRLRKRVANGVCPCCNRQFTNLGRHMATKHPEYQGEAAA